MSADKAKQPLVLKLFKEMTAEPSMGEVPFMTLQILHHMRMDGEDGSNMFQN